MHKRVCTLAVFSWIALAHAQDEGHLHDHHARDSSAVTEAPINITVNPEVRVSVTRGGKLPPAAPCGEAIEIPVKIVNQGFLTAPLQATLVDSDPGEVSVEFVEVPLKGTREEHRVLRVVLQKPGTLDVTIAFRAKNDISDLGGRDRIHLLLWCN